MALRTRVHIIAVDRIACDGRGLCAELLPELIDLDEWGYPVIGDPALPQEMLPHAKRAVAACPVLALRLEVRASPPTRAG